VFIEGFESDDGTLEADRGVDGVVNGLVTVDLATAVCFILSVGVISDFN
jgi:hypothetical protein